MHRESSFSIFPALRYRNRLLDSLRHCIGYKHDPTTPQYKTNCVSRSQRSRKIVELLKLGVVLLSFRDGMKINGFCYCFDIGSRKTISNNIVRAFNVSDVGSEP
ncbi:hypothetical protein ACTXT7_004193 [Hymenolepis weldensis]